MEKYDNLIYYSICECLYEEMKANKVTGKSTTFRNLCGGIASNLNNNLSLSTEQYNILANTIVKMNLIYGEDDGRIGQYISEFFKKEMWLKYYKIVMTLNSNLPFAIQR